MHLDDEREREKGMSKFGKGNDREEVSSVG